MNKRILLIVALALLSLAVFVSCGCRDEEKEERVVVTFETNTDTLIAAQVLKPGDKIKEPTEVLDYPAYRLIGWYCNGVKWDFANDVVTVDMELTAKFDRYLTVIEAEGDSGDMWLASCKLDVENAVIPEVLNGKTITRIRNCAFAERKILRSVVIAETITHIEGKVFYGCDKLESIVIPKGVTIMESGAFENCESLQYIYCEAEEMPEGWAEDFNKTNAQVIWGYKK